MFKLTFLGTSSGVPTKNRNVTSLALQSTVNRDWWMIDCGEATQHRLQHLSLSVHELAGICITHVHGDHTYGLPGLLASASMTGRKRPLILIAPLAVKLWLDATMLHSELFLTFPLVHVDVAANTQVHQEPGLTISRHELSHRAPSVTPCARAAWRRVLCGASCRQGRTLRWTMAACWPRRTFAVPMWTVRWPSLAATTTRPRC